MKILIADDRASRYKVAVNALNEIGVRREDIDLVGSAADARAKMVTTQYDLMILDILIPLRPEEEPVVQHSLDLLTEIHETDDLIKPRHILGITADRNVTGDAATTFASHTWAVIDYSEVTDDWLARITNCVKYLQNSESPNGVQEVTRVDLIILCALQAPELEEVLKLPWAWAPARPIDDQTFVHDGHFYSDGQKFSVCAAFAPRMGMVATALRSHTLINALKPKMIGMTGICAGVRGKVDIGDVILIDPSWDFQSGKRTGGEGGAQFAIAPHQLYASTKIRAHVQQIKNDRVALAKIAADFLNEAPRTPKIMIGPVASGSAVLADGQIIHEIKAQHRELIGVEMEVYGLYAAAQAVSEPKPGVFALKAVCDFADTQKGDDYQRFAAYTSAQVLKFLFECHGARLIA